MTVLRWNILFQIVVNHVEIVASDTNYKRLSALKHSLQGRSAQYPT